MRDYRIKIRTRSGRNLEILAIARSTVEAMNSVVRAVGEMPARISGRPA